MQWLDMPKQVERDIEMLIPKEQLDGAWTSFMRGKVHVALKIFASALKSWQSAGTKHFLIQYLRAHI